MTATRCAAAIAAGALLVSMLAACTTDDGPVESGVLLDYTPAAGERHSYAEYKTPSALYYHPREADYWEVTIGGDLEPREPLRHILTSSDGIRHFLGQSRDGVGVPRLENYRDDLRTKDGDYPFGLSGTGFYPFSVQPRLYLDADFYLPENEDLFVMLFTSIQVVNDALPPEFQLARAAPHPTGIAGRGEILIELESPSSISLRCGIRVVACARTRTLGNFALSSTLYIPDNFDLSDLRNARKVMIHELLHALGIQGHVDSVEFPDSIMGTAGEHIPNLGFVLGKIDREVLQIMYMSQITDLYNDWGEWSDVTHHFMGASEDNELRFGVALFNGLPQPWARGRLPDEDLADNRRLFGTATWSGALFGFSGPSPIAGDAELQVRMSTLSNPNSEQDLRFRDIIFLNRFDSETEDRWFYERNIDYKVRVSRNAFFNVVGDGYEQGLVSGSFMGAQHEHMGGTVKRTDMVGAFGGSR